MNFGGKPTMSLGFVAACCLGVAVLSLGMNGCEERRAVNANTCLACHDGRTSVDQRTFLDGAHRSLECEECHGSGILHVRNGGRGGLFIDNPGDLSFDESYSLCQRCHEENVDGYLGTRHAETRAATCQSCHDVHTENGLRAEAASDGRFNAAAQVELCGSCHGLQTDDFMLSGHAQFGVASCASCHDAHQSDLFAETPEDNSLCLQCHASGLLGFDTIANIDFHTGLFHPVDPLGSGSSRCTACHLPPLEEAGQPDVPHDHTLFTVPPIATVQAAFQGVFPLPPNSCAGVMGCHDPNVPGSGSPRDVTDLALNEILQPIYASIGKDPLNPDEPDPEDPSGAELLRIITVDDPYEEWGQFPEATGIIESSPPHGPFSRVFVNALVESAFDDFDGQLPDGSIIVKESFDQDMQESGDSITVMWKVKDFSPLANDWFWAVFSFDREILNEGSIGGCISCHGAVSGNDFVFLHQFGP